MTQGKSMATIHELLTSFQDDLLRALALPLDTPDAEKEIREWGVKLGPLGEALAKAFKAVRDADCTFHDTYENQYCDYDPLCAN